VRTWTRAVRSRLCGRCSTLIGKGEPLFVLTIAAGVYALTDPKIRCQSCAGEPVPEDLPPLVARVPAEPMAFTKVGALAFDFKMAVAGREPGEDDA
jgi:hypothetical protein